MVSILIDGEPLDLNSNTRVLLTYTLAEITSIDGRTGGYSNSVSLAWTNKNLALLDFFNIIQIINAEKKPSNKIKCLVRQGGEEQRKGFIQIVEYTEGVEINVILYGENADLYNRIKDRPISELDFSEYDHAYTNANVQSSWENTDGYVYPIINFGKLNTRSVGTNTTISNTRIFPYVYEHTVIRKIIEKAGYVLKSDFTKTFLGSRTIVNNGKRAIKPDLFKKNRDFKAFLVGYPVYIGGTFKIPFINDQKPNGFNGGLCYSNATSTFTCDEAMNVSFNGQIVFAILKVDFEVLTFYIYKNNAPLTVLKDYNTALAGTYNLIFTTPTYIAAQGDVFDIRVVVGTSQVEIAQFAANLYTYWESDVKTDLAEGENVRIGAFLPDKNQDIFFKDYFKRFCLILVADPYSGEVLIESYEKWIKPLKYTEDWSDRLDVNKPIEGDFEIKTYARNNQFKYAEDSKDTFINEGQIASDATFTIDNDFVEQSKDLIVSMYAPTALGKSFNDQLILPCMQAENDPNEEEDFTPRILVYYGLSKIADDFGKEVRVSDSSVNSWLFNGSYLEEIPFAYFSDNILGYGLREYFYEFLDFPYLIDRFYTMLLGRVQNSRIKKVYLHYSAKDILNLDFSKPIYLAKFNACFYLNKVIEKDLTINGSTKTELLTL